MGMFESKDGFINVDPEYRNYANKVDKPVEAAKDDKAEKPATKSAQPKQTATSEDHK